MVSVELPIQSDMIRAVEKSQFLTNLVDRKEATWDVVKLSCGCVVEAQVKRTETYSEARKNKMNDKQIVLTVFLAILEYRLFLFALSLISITIFLLFIYLRPKLKRSSVLSKWPRLWGRNPNSDTQTSSPTLAHDPGQLYSLDELRIPGSPLSIQNSQLQYIEIGFIQPAQSSTPNEPPNHLTSTETESPTTSYRSETIASQPQPAVTRTLSGGQGLQPLRRTSSLRESVLQESTVDERHAGADTNSELYPHASDAGSLPTALAWSPSTLPLSNPNYGTSNAGISNVKFPGSPTSVASIPDEEVSMEIPGRRDSIYTEKSVATLPVYKENDDERMSIASRAPTYRSTIIPREPMPPLPVPPSIYIPKVISTAT